MTRMREHCRRCWWLAWERWGARRLYQSAKLGARAIGIDRFVPPHDQGSSHGDTRITREAIGEGREFVPLVLRSNQIWQEIEAATGRNLLTRNGGLVLASPSMPGSHHGSTSFIQDTIAAATEFGITHEVLEHRANYAIAIRSSACETMRSATSNPAPDFYVPRLASRRSSSLAAAIGRARRHLGSCYRTANRCRMAPSKSRPTPMSTKPRRSLSPPGHGFRSC